jgi:hypothetical protein
VSRVANVKICQFWTEVLFPSFPITQVPPMKKIKIEGTKNKVFKPQ